jgi:hypothetical protein
MERISEEFYTRTGIEVCEEAPELGLIRQL